MSWWSRGFQLCHLEKLISTGVRGIQWHRVVSYTCIVPTANCHPIVFGLSVCRYWIELGAISPHSTLQPFLLSFFSTHPPSLFISFFLQLLPLFLLPSHPPFPPNAVLFPPFSPSISLFFPPLDLCPKLSVLPSHNSCFTPMYNSAQHTQIYFSI